MSDPQPIAACCLQGFSWDGTPTGSETTLASLPTYITGSNPDRAILYIHDLLGWRFPNARLLADHLAREVDATVYVPNFFGTDELDWEAILAGNWGAIDLQGWHKRNARDIREPSILACARALREQQQPAYKKVGAVGYCFGGWAVFRLGAQEHAGLVDCISAGHPTWLTKDDVDNVKVPTQLLAPEKDGQFPLEMKEYSFKTLMANSIAYEYHHYPGVEHACFTRGDPKLEGERAALERGKNAAVAWFRQWLY